MGSRPHPHAGSQPAPRGDETDHPHAGSQPAPRGYATHRDQRRSASPAAHAGDPEAARALKDRTRRGRAGGARARRRRVSARKGQTPAKPGVYGPKDHSAWGCPKDPRYRRDDAWTNELPLHTALLERCVLVVAEDLECSGGDWDGDWQDLLEIYPVGVLCTPMRVVVLWWIDLHHCRDVLPWLPGPAQVEAQASSQSIESMLTTAPHRQPT